MLRALFSVLSAATLCTITQVSYAAPLSQSQAPQLGLGVLDSKWKKSAILTEAVEMLNRGERQQAKAKLAQFLKQYPSDPRGPELAGMILIEEKNYQVAALSFQRALTLNPNNPGALAKLGVTLLLQGRNKEGEDKLQQAIAMQSGEPLARRYLGWLDEGRGNLNGAGHHYVAAIKGDGLPEGTVTDIHLALGRVYSALGRHEQTIRLLAPYMAKSATGEIGQAARFQLAFAYIELKRGAEAAPLIQSLEKSLKPDNPELRYLKAYAQLDSQPAQAREKFQALIKSHPEYSGRTRLLIARSYAVEGNTSLAVKELESLAAQVDKADLPEVLTALTSMRLTTGKVAEARSVLEAYSKKHPDIPEIAYLLSEVRFHSGDIANTQSLLKQLLSKYPNYAPAYALLGQVERSQNALAQAEEHSRKAVTLDSNLTNAWVTLAGVYVSRKDLGKAEAALKQGLETNPGNALLQYELANIYDAMGRGKDANALYRSILSAYPNYLPALNNLAVNLAEINDLAAAKQYAEKAYKLDSRNPVVQDTYGWILVLNNDVQKGLPLLEQAARDLSNDASVLYHLGSTLIKLGKAEEGKRYLQRSLAAGLQGTPRQKAQALVN